MASQARPGRCKRRRDRCGHSTNFEVGAIKERGAQMHADIAELKRDRDQIIILREQLKFVVDGIRDIREELKKRP